MNMSRFSILRALAALPRLLALAAVLALPVLASQALAASGTAVPTNISADKLQYDMDARTVTFEGKVVVDRSDIKINAEKIVVRFSPAKEGEAKPTDGGFDPGRIKVIEASRNVVVHYQGRVGRCGRATYDVPAGLLSMEDNPVIEDGENRIQGQVIRFNFKENRSEVVGGGNKRVEATFSTPKGLEVPGAQ